MLQISPKYIIHSRTYYVKKYVEPYRIDLSPTEWAYIAGLIDSDGSIYAYRWSRSKHFQKYRIEVVITNTSNELIEWLRQKIPYHNLHWSRSAKKWRCWLFSIYNVGAVYYTLLNTVDRLVLKQILARKALEFVYYKILYYHTSSKEVHELYDRLYNEIRYLNALGYGFSPESYSGYYDFGHDEEFYAYLAGVIDGDGSIIISDKGSRGWEVYLIIGTKVREYAEWLHRKLVGSKLWEITTSKGNTMYNVVLSCKGVIAEILHRIEKYLIVKKDRARKVLEMLS